MESALNHYIWWLQRFDTANGCRFLASRIRSLLPAPHRSSPEDRIGPRTGPPSAPHQDMEFVYVVPRAALFPDFYPHGLICFQDAPAAESACVSRPAFEASIAREGFFVERSVAERTPAWKQLIPYTLVQCGERILLTRRTKSGGEARLHDKHSIGIGGHINPVDLEEGAASALRNPLPNGARREISEELEVRGAYELRAVGVLNDDSNSVGAVHVGVVHVMRVDGTVEVREKEQLEGRLVTVRELRELAERGANLETWTRLLLPHLEELLFTPTAVAT